jgi:Sulfotransferase family
MTGRKAETGMNVQETSPPAPPKWTSYRYVFVVTYARSGSTLLQSLLNSCNGVQIRGENNNALFHLYRAISAVQATRKFGWHPQTKARDEPWYGAGEVKPLLLEANLLNSFVRNVLAPDPATKVTGFKEVRYNRQFIANEHFAPYMDYLLAKFPNSKIVFNSRRADDVVKSGFLAKQNPHNVRTAVAEADTNFATYDAGSDRTIHMYYEDYVADHAQIHRMLSFLNLDWNAEVIEQVFAKPLTHAKAKTQSTTTTEG